MATNAITVNVPPREVFAVLSDGWTFTNWVVGASHMRAVDAGWPAVGSRLHHAAGAWPALVRDETEVEEVEPARRLVLVARGRPMGEAKVVLELEDDPAGCRITMHEWPLAGPGKTLHNPLFERLLVRRNSESLSRLAALCERRTEPRT